MSSTGDDIVSTVLWMLFGHYSQTFDWLVIWGGNYSPDGQLFFDGVSYFDAATNSSLARMSIVVGLKLFNGVFFSTHLCGAFETVCQYGFLRGVITTVDYQLYYLDYLLSRNANTQSLLKLEEDGVKSSHIQHFTKDEGTQRDAVNISTRNK
ncbi:hypothetical protein HDV06_002530 [Boothiomyces sp. JEL0866]|nr:hypothetical protein HDV06_002530 [Boothiomyces sp. JEL0866]